MIVRHSTTAGAVPATSALQDAELAFNIRDGILYARANDGTTPRIETFLPKSQEPMVLLQTADLTGAATAVFTFPSGYKHFALVGSGINATSNPASFYASFSTDGGTTWDGQTYTFQYQSGSSFTATNVSGHFQFGVAYPDAGGGADAASIRLDVIDPLSLVVTTAFAEALSINGSGVLQYFYCAAQPRTPQIHNAMQIYPSSGTFTKGKVSLYGIRG